MTRTQDSGGGCERKARKNTGTTNEAPKPSLLPTLSECLDGHAYQKGVVSNEGATVVAMVVGFRQKNART